MNRPAMLTAAMDPNAKKNGRRRADRSAENPIDSSCQFSAALLTGSKSVTVHAINTLRRTIVIVFFDWSIDIFMEITTETAAHCAVCGEDT